MKPFLKTLVRQEDLGVAARRALALAHAAIDRPTPSRVIEAKRILMGILRALPVRPVQDLLELGRSLQRTLDALLTVERRVCAT